MNNELEKMGAKVIAAQFEDGQLDKHN